MPEFALGAQSRPIDWAEVKIEKGGDVNPESEDDECINVLCKYLLEWDLLNDREIEHAEADAANFV